MAATEEEEGESSRSTDTDEPEFVPKKGATSVIWSWFGFRPSDLEQNIVFCKTCRRTVVAKGGNTSNLFHHLKQKHNSEYSKAVKARDEASADVVVKPKKLAQKTIDAALTSGTPYEKGSRRWRDLTSAVTRCLARDMMPIQSVERDGFTKMLTTFDSRYKLPPKKYFSKVALPALYEEVRSEDHTGQNIAKGFKEFLTSWDLQEEKQVCVTTDSGANVVKAIALNNWTRISCFGHRLHIAIERSVKDPRIERAVGVGKKIVAAFGHSWKRQRALHAAQKELGLPEHKLITECCTRWGSRQRMIQRLLEQEKAIAQVLAADKTTRHLMLTWQDIEVLDSVNTALSPLLEFTDAFSAEEYVTIPCVKPVLQIFNNDLLKVNENDTQLTKDIKTAILDYMNKSYKDTVTERVVNMASLLDPRFRAEYLSESECEAIKVQALNEMEHLQVLSGQTSSEQGSTPAGALETPPSSSAEQLCQVAAKKPKKSLGSFLKGAVGEKTEVTAERLLSELSSYMNSPPVDSESDPLLWWKIHTVNFPHISRLARKYLCIPATSSASERLFSTGGNVVTCQRSSLKPTT
ncbi:hypothetical protein WMY93_002242 [Mugilogobius chulae]|uniref:BED-type domain-containing protein n=1 Tax=Mugilogobius chulae TaxID=88201 RepID=A0AAW0Q883_9GOBI